jgi:hypothetical protein
MKHVIAPQLADNVRHFVIVVTNRAKRMLFRYRLQDRHDGIDAKILQIHGGFIIVVVIVFKSQSSRLNIHDFMHNSSNKRRDFL